MPFRSHPNSCSIFMCLFSVVGLETWSRSQDLFWRLGPGLGMQNVSVSKGWSRKHWSWSWSQSRKYWSWSWSTSRPQAANVLLSRPLETSANNDFHAHCRPRSRCFKQVITCRCIIQREALEKLPTNFYKAAVVCMQCKVPY